MLGAELLMQMLGVGPANTPGGGRSPGEGIGTLFESGNGTQRGGVWIGGPLGFGGLGGGLGGVGGGRMGDYVFSNEGMSFSPSYSPMIPSPISHSIPHIPCPIIFEFLSYLHRECNTDADALIALEQIMNQLMENGHKPVPLPDKDIDELERDVIDVDSKSLPLDISITYLFICSHSCHHITLASSCLSSLHSQTASLYFLQDHFLIPRILS
jgi:hypothetical protein